MTRIVAVIPARMGSWRFPGKPLALLCGRPMVEHVYRHTAACDLLDEVIVATCDQEIADAVQSFGAKAVMTSGKHERASDRVAEAVEKSHADIVVMVQGDEPMIRPAMISAAVEPMLADLAIECVNLAAPIRNEQELNDKNTIKVTMSNTGNALYFSREPIPTVYSLPFKEGEWYKQVCVIPFRRRTLEKFATLPEGILERAESIDMLRLLENGIPVHMVRTEYQTHAVDTPDDLRYVESLMEDDAWEVE